MSEGEQDMHDRKRHDRQDKNMRVRSLLFRRARRGGGRGVRKRRHFFMDIKSIIMLKLILN
jgi:hypothetical protein